MAANVYAIAKNYREAADIAKEAQLRAERRAGEFLEDAPKQHGARPPDAGFHDESPSLPELGINIAQSSRWQSIATIPEVAFEQHIAERRNNGKELTQTGLLQLATAGVVWLVKK